jgi:hypothetical protein
VEQSVARVVARREHKRRALGVHVVDHRVRGEVQQAEAAQVLPVEIRFRRFGADHHCASRAERAHDGARLAPRVRERPELRA